MSHLGWYACFAMCLAALFLGLALDRDALAWAGGALTICFGMSDPE